VHPRKEGVTGLASPGRQAEDIIPQRPFQERSGIMKMNLSIPASISGASSDSCKAWTILVLPELEVPLIMMIFPLSIVFPHCIKNGRPFSGAPVTGI
jgi:hypothetical protein